MFRNSLLVLIAVVALGLIVIGYRSIFVPPSSTFVIRNLDSESVRVIARWRDASNDLGEIPARGDVEFSVSDEASMSFEVRRSNGTAVDTGGIPFAAGSAVEVEITRSAVVVKHVTDD